jgi:ATP-binding cassette, subfamily B (MDR/TAP), member 1
VIAEGSIQELGSHRKLFEEGGIYTQLCEAQGLTADCTDGAATGVETQDGWKGAVVNATETTPTKDEQPNVDPDDVDVELGAADDGDKKEADEEAEMASPSRLWQYNRPEVWYMAVGVVGALIVGALPPVEGILFGVITANFFAVEDVELMQSENRTLSLYFLILAGASFIGNLALGSFAVSGSRLTRRMRVKVFEKIMRQPMGWFDFPAHSTGELTTSLEEDAEAVANVTGYQLGQRIQIAASLVAGITISLSFSWQIGLIALACIPLIIGSGMLQARCTRPRTIVGDDGLSAPTILERGFHDIFVLQAFNLQDVVSDQYANALKPDAEYKVKQGFYTGLVYGVTQCAVFSTFALLFYAGIELMVAGKVSFQDFFIALLSVMFAAFGVGQANSDFGARQRGLVAAARIFSLLDEPLNADDPLSKEGNTPLSLEGNVTFKSVGFSYPSRPETQVFYSSPGRDGFNLSIPAKQSVAFTGRSGCGKSTALQLCMRFYTASTGSVNLDDENVAKLNMAWLRGSMGYVGQMPVLFQGSVRDNVRLGKPGATEDEIVEACRAANAHEFVTKLSDQYDTDIGAGGSLLSGGMHFFHSFVLI